MKIEKLSQTNTLIIANHWHYQEQYAFYDLQADPEDYAEMISPEQRGENYFQVIDAQGRLSGFFVIEKLDKLGTTVAIGLGMAPERTGKGMGREFVGIIIEDVQRRLSPTKIVLDVAKFNQRAQKVYAALGFQQTRAYQQATNGGYFPFVEMVKDVHSTEAQ